MSRTYSSFKKKAVVVTFLRRTPTSITIHPVSLFSILDHYLRRTDAQDRVIGTLLGIHNDNEVEVRSSFAVLHSETDEQVAVDTDYHQTMYDLHHKVNPKEVIVGWLVHYSIFNGFSRMTVFQGTQQGPISTLILLLFKTSILKKQHLIKRYTLL